MCWVQLICKIHIKYRIYLLNSWPQKFIMWWPSLYRIRKKEECIVEADQFLVFHDSLFLLGSISFNKHDRHWMQEMILDHMNLDHLFILNEIPLFCFLNYQISLLVWTRIFFEIYWFRLLSSQHVFNFSLCMIIDENIKGWVF